MVCKLFTSTSVGLMWRISVPMKREMPLYLDPMAVILDLQQFVAPILDRDIDLSRTCDQQEVPRSAFSGERDLRDMGSWNDSRASTPD